MLLGSRTYGPGVDMWAAGCIMAELANGTPLFRGQSDLQQVGIVFAHRGGVDVSTWPEVTRLPDYGKIGVPQASDPHACVQEAAPRLDPEGRNLIARLLSLNQGGRGTASEALEHAWFRGGGAPATAREIYTYLKRERLI